MGYKGEGIAVGSVLGLIAGILLAPATGGASLILATAAGASIGAGYEATQAGAAQITQQVADQTAADALRLQQQQAADALALKQKKDAIDLASKQRQEQIDTLAANQVNDLAQFGMKQTEQGNTQARAIGNVEAGATQGALGMVENYAQRGVKVGAGVVGGTERAVSGDAKLDLTESPLYSLMAYAGNAASQIKSSGQAFQAGQALDLLGFKTSQYQTMQGAQQQNQFLTEQGSLDVQQFSSQIALNETQLSDQISMSQEQLVRNGATATSDLWLNFWSDTINTGTGLLNSLWNPKKV